MNNCIVCGKAAQSMCGRCNFFGYCSADCQKKHWLTHKSKCKSSAELKTTCMRMIGVRIMGEIAVFDYYYGRGVITVDICGSIGELQRAYFQSNEDRFPREFYAFITWDGDQSNNNHTNDTNNNTNDTNNNYRTNILGSAMKSFVEGGSLESDGIKVCYKLSESDDIIGVIYTRPVYDPELIKKISKPPLDKMISFKI